MEDKIITFTIPGAKVQRVIDAMKRIYPITTTTDEEGNTTNDFTDNQWAKEAVRRLIIRTVGRYERKKAKEEANVPEDDEIIS